MNPSVRLVELIAQARHEGECPLYGLATRIMNSSRGLEIVSDFERWGLLEREIIDGEELLVVPEFWDPYVLPKNPAEPDGAYFPQ